MPGTVMCMISRKYAEDTQRSNFKFKGKDISISNIKRYQARYPDFDPTSSLISCMLASPPF